MSSRGKIEVTLEVQDTLEEMRKKREKLIKN